MASCLGCEHWQPPAPFDNIWDAKDHMRKTTSWLEGFCTLYPKWEKVSAGHHCGQYRDRRPLDADQELYGTWLEQEAKSLAKTVKELKSQLAAARKISASRLKRLQNSIPIENPKPTLD